MDNHLSSFLIRLKVGIKPLYRSVVNILAVIGLITCVNWIWKEYVYGIHRNSSVEDIVVTSNLDTVFHYKRLPPHTAKLNFVKGELEISYADGRYEFQRIPKGSEILLIEYKDGGRKSQNQFFY